MGIQFGVGTLKVLDNLNTSCFVSASTTTLTAVGGLCMIDGVTAIISANATQLTAFVTTGEGATGTGLLYYAYIQSGSTITATLAVATAGSPLATGGTQMFVTAGCPICPLARFSFGTGANNISTFLAVSGGSATKTISKVQKVSINVSYEMSQMRGGHDVFPVDTKFFDGKVEGSFDAADPTAIHGLFLGGVYATAAGTSGTWTLSGNSKPNPMSLVFTNVTDGKTATYTVMRAYITQQTNDFSRTDFLQPSFNFVAQANFQGTVLKIEG